MRIFRPSSIIGLKEQDAKNVIEKNQYFWRITRKDNEFFIRNTDTKDDRVSMQIEDGIVVDAYVG
jgi:hypothetical protein